MSSSEEEDVGEGEDGGVSKEDKHNKYKFHYGVVNLTKERNLLAKPLVRKNERKQSWIAINTIDYYNKLIKLWPPCEDLLKTCTFPMRIHKFEFLWRDDENYPTPTKLPSAEYIRLSFKMIRDNIQDESIFVEVEPFPKIFKEVVREMFKKMFRIYGHFLTERILSDQLVKFKMGALCTTIFKHFMKFAFEFRLIRKRDIIPMNDWILENMGEEYREKLHIIEKKKKKKKRSKEEKQILKEEKRRKKEEKRRRKEERRKRKEEKARLAAAEDESSVTSSTMVVNPSKSEEPEVDEIEAKSEENDNQEKPPENEEVGEEEKEQKEQKEEEKGEEVKEEEDKEEEKPEEEVKEEAEEAEEDEKQGEEEKPQEEEEEEVKEEEKKEEEEPKEEEEKEEEEPKEEEKKAEVEDEPKEEETKEEE